MGAGSSTTRRVDSRGLLALRDVVASGSGRGTGRHVKWSGNATQCRDDGQDAENGVEGRRTEVWRIEKWR